MNRKKFIKTCGIGSFCLFSGSVLLDGCATVKYLNGTLTASSLEVPVDSFKIIDKEQVKFRKYVVVQHDNLKYPICVYRKSDSAYQALLMKCTHQGTELRVYGDKLECPAHGSEFSNAGIVQNGPADTSLRSFPVNVENGILKINLA